MITVEIGEEGARGRAEAVPYPRYGQTVASSLEEIAAVRPAVEEGADREALLTLMAPSAARNALDCALWDLEAKRAGLPVWRLAGLERPRELTTAYTLSLDTPEAMGRAAAANRRRPLLKVKLDAEAVSERLRAVRAGAPEARLAVDANEAWDIDLLRALAGELAALGVVAVEQPLPAGEDGALEGLDCPVPLCADESCRGADGAAGLAGRYDMVNVKLDKTGGLTGALALRKSAREAGLAVMVGCMVGTSLAMAPAMLAAQGAALVDLDGPLLMERDREPGIVFDGSAMLPCPPGLWG